MRQNRFLVLWQNPSWLLALICGIMLSLIPFYAASAHVVANNAGHITGQLLDGTKHNTPISRQSVTLQMAQGTTSKDLASVTTDAHGAYSFSNLATDKTISYALFINYQGAQYTSNVVTLDSKPVQQVNLTVYEATSDSSKLAIVRATVLIHAPDARKGSFTVSEAFAFDNLDTHAFVGSLDATKGRPKALFFSLPAGAHNVSLDKGFDGYRSIQADAGFASDVALLPGMNEFALSFEVPYTASSYNFRYVAMYPTVDLSMMVPPQLHASSSALTPQGTITAQDQPYLLLHTTKLLQNQQVNLSLEGLPTSKAPTSTPAQLNTTTVWLIVGAVLLLAVLFIAWFFFRPAHLQMATGSRKGSKQSGRKGATTSVKARSAATPKEQQQVLLAELLELDKAFEAGKLKKAVYQERRAKTKARLRTVMSEQEAAKR
jgi:hypothetical protein